MDNKLKLMDLMQANGPVLTAVNSRSFNKLVENPIIEYSTFRTPDVRLTDDQLKNMSVSEFRRPFTNSFPYDVNDEKKKQAELSSMAERHKAKNFYNPFSKVCKETGAWLPIGLCEAATLAGGIYLVDLWWVLGSLPLAVAGGVDRVRRMQLNSYKRQLKHVEEGLEAYNTFLYNVMNARVHYKCYTQAGDLVAKAKDLERQHNETPFVDALKVNYTTLNQVLADIYTNPYSNPYISTKQ